MLLANFTRTFSGVQWSDDGDCGKQSKNCLLTLCGDTSVLFPSAVVRNVNISKTAAMLLCLAGSSDVVFEAAQFEGNAVRPLTVLSPGVMLHVKASNFTDNKLRTSPAKKDLLGGAMLKSNGTAVVESSNFSANVVLSNGAAIAVESSGSIQLVSSVLFGNRGMSSRQ
mgnify:CR=1 FL=1